MMGEAVIAAPPCPTGIILTYHNILPPGCDPETDAWSIPLDRLNEHLTALLENGFTGLTLEEVAAHLTSEHGTSGKPCFAVTFDDGYASLHRYLPELWPRIKPTVFLLTDCVGKDNGWNTRADRVLEHLSMEMVRDLQSAGIDMQLHGCDHHKLTKFTEAELSDRFERGIDWFIGHLGGAPRHLSYPYGTCNRLIKEVASRYFQAAFATNHGAWHGADARFALNRISVPGHLDGEGLLAVVRAQPQLRWWESEKRAPGRMGARPLG
jgi:peptidoglycan/xylan/chitin deacetylase (PgdA/CDA1 family)